MALGILDWGSLVSQLPGLVQSGGDIYREATGAADRERRVTLERERLRSETERARIQAAADRGRTSQATERYRQKQSTFRTLLLAGAALTIVPIVIARAKSARA